MKILHVASECTPYAKVGGLGDVIGALPKALESLGEESGVILPMYQHLLNGKFHLVQDTFDVEFLGKKEPCQLYKTQFAHSLVPLYLVRNDTYLSNGGIYLSTDAMAVGDDEPRRFMFFCTVVYDLLRYQRIEPNIIHCHDWHTSFLTRLIYEDHTLHKRIKTVLSVHNLANKGTVSDVHLNRAIDGNGHHHALMAVGVENADRVVPVAETYCNELLDGLYCDGLETVVHRNKDKFVGITNGIDTDYFNPETDGFLSKRYDVSTYKQGKFFEKDKLYAELGWGSEAKKTLLFGFVGRIAKQKNIELIVKTIERLEEEDIRFVFLGVGDSALTDLLKKLSAHLKNRVHFANRFDESFARQIYAASDVFLVPSLYEPCGLTQMIAMRYGSLPVVRRVGGLADTVQDGKNGFVFDKSIVSALLGTIMKAHLLYRSDTERWHRMIQYAMTSDFSWTGPAKKYIDVYTSLIMSNFDSGSYSPLPILTPKI